MRILTLFSWQSTWYIIFYCIHCTSIFFRNCTDNVLVLADDFKDFKLKSPSCQQIHYVEFLMNISGNISNFLHQYDWQTNSYRNIAHAWLNKFLWTLWKLKTYIPVFLKSLAVEKKKAHRPILTVGFCRDNYLVLLITKKLL